MAFRVTQAVVVEPEGPSAGAGILVLEVGTYATRDEAQAVVRDLTKTSGAFFRDAQWVAPEMRDEFLVEFLDNRKYLANRRYFIGDPPIDELTAAIARQKTI